METKLFTLILSILLITSVSGMIICVDKTPPSPPSNLILTASGNNIQLIWDVAIDIPDCSGISHYDIYRGFNNGNLSLIGTSSDTTYLDTGLSDGTYTYMIHAWDLAGHQEGNGVSGEITIGYVDNGVTPSSGGGGGGGGNGDSSYWQCGEWSECVNKTQTRTCIDLDKNLPDRTETKECLYNFISSGSSGTNEEEEEEENLETIDQTNQISKITGAVTGFVKTGKGTAAIIFVFSILILGIIVMVIQKNKVTKKK